MNAGAARARAEVLWFLHADSLPPVQALKLIRQALVPEGVVGGAFAHRFVEPVWSLHVINWMNRLRYRLTHNYYGDQGLFVRTAVFRQRWVAIARFNVRWPPSLTRSTATATAASTRSPTVRC